MQTSSSWSKCGLLSSWGAQASHCGGLSRGAARALGWASAAGGCGLQELWLSDSRMQVLIAVAHGLSCPEEGGIFQEQELNSCPLHW